MKIQFSLAVFMVLLLVACSKDDVTTSPDLDEMEFDKVIYSLSDAISVNKEVEDPFNFIRNEIESKEKNKNQRKKECPCEQLDWVFSSTITETSVNISWGLPKECGSYYMIIYNKTADTYAYYYSLSVTSLILEDLTPCSTYEVTVGHVGTSCSSVGMMTTFTTYCDDYCNAGSFNASELYVLYIGFTLDGEAIFSNNSTIGYVDKTDETIAIPSNTTTDFSRIGWCTQGGWTSDVYSKLWIDYNDNKIFESTELMYNSVIGPYQSPNVLNCVDVIKPNFTTPNYDACNVRARFIISTSPIFDPCVTVGRGQVLDFTVDIGNC